jgi:hypothetical protein
MQEQATKTPQDLDDLGQLNSVWRNAHLESPAFSRPAIHSSMQLAIHPTAARPILIGLGNSPRSIAA